MNNKNKETSCNVKWCNVTCRKPCNGAERQKTINNQLHQPAAVISDSNADLFKVQAGNGEMPMDNKNKCGAQQGSCDTMLF